MSRSAFSHLSFSARSELGLKRKNNEDSFGTFPSFGVWCVADGMGGGDDGEIASAEVVQKVDEFCAANPFPDGSCYAGDEVAAGVVDAVNAASEWIFARAESKKLKGCGSTFVAAVFDAAHPERAIALHAGDSRLYRIRGRDIKQITKDHSAAELVGAKRDSDLNPMFRGMILRAVGILRSVEVEKTPFTVKKGDTVLICSDGLSKMVPDSKIASAVNKAGDDLEAAADALIGAAYKAGATDNVTVELVRVGELPPPSPVARLYEDPPGDDDGPDTLDTSGGLPNTTADTTGAATVADTMAPRQAMPVPPSPPPSRQPRATTMPAWLVGVAAGVAIGVVATLVFVSVRGCGGRAVADAAGPVPAPPPQASAEVVQAADPAAGRAAAAPPVAAPQPPPPEPKRESPAARRQPPAAPPAPDPFPSAPEPSQPVPEAVSKEPAKSAEQMERESLEARLEAMREKVLGDEAVAAQAADMNHAAAVALGETCREEGVVDQFTRRMEDLGASCASLRSSARRLAQLKRDENGVDVEACNIVRELQKMASSSNAALRAALGRAATRRFAEMDPTSAEAFKAAAAAIKAGSRRERGDVGP